MSVNQEKMTFVAIAAITIVVVGSVVMNLLAVLLSFEWTLASFVAVLATHTAIAIKMC